MRSGRLRERERERQGQGQGWRQRQKQRQADGQTKGQAVLYNAQCILICNIHIFYIYILSIHVI